MGGPFREQGGGGRWRFGIGAGSPPATVHGGSTPVSRFWRGEWVGDDEGGTAKSVVGFGSSGCGRRWGLTGGGRGGHRRRASCSLCTLGSVLPAAWSRPRGRGEHGEVHRGVRANPGPCIGPPSRRASAAPSCGGSPVGSELPVRSYVRVWV